MFKSSLYIFVNKFHLNFKDKSFEKEFRADSVESLKVFLRFSVIIALSAFFLVAFSGLLSHNESIFLYDGVIMVLSGILFLAYSYSKYYSKYYLFVISFLNIFGCIGMIYSLHGYENLYLHIHLRILFFTLVTFITIQLNLFSSLAILLAIISSPFFFTDTSFSDALTSALSLIPFLLLSTFTLYLKQKVERSNYLKQKQLQKYNSVLQTDNKMLEFQGAIGILLQKSTDINLDLKDFLDEALTIILELSWLKIMNKGSIFITNKEGNLEMVASQNLGELTKTCALVKPGQCLCGKALEKKELLFSNCVTDDHTIRHKEMLPHGHYNAPILLKDEVLGVLNIYVEHGHEQNEEESDFILLLADAIASVVYRDQLEKDKGSQAKEISEAHFKVKSSIEYAQRIQQSLLASSNSIKNIFSNVLIKFLPKETVSGDFYLVKKANNLTYVIVSDCTGHGVPGALVSTLGIQEISHIIESSGEEINVMLDQLNKKVNFLLNNDDQIGSDGMDLILLCIDETKKTIKYTGAKGLFYMYQNDELIRYKTDSYSIGQNYDEAYNFSVQTIKYKENDSVFLLTDGIIDQLSKVDNRRIGTKRVKQLMQTISEADSTEKAKLLDEFLIKHKAPNHQIDDITFINFKL